MNASIVRKTTLLYPLTVTDGRAEVWMPADAVVIDAVMSNGRLCVVGVIPLDGPDRLTPRTFVVVGPGDTFIGADGDTLEYIGCPQKWTNTNEPLTLVFEEVAE